MEFKSLKNIESSFRQIRLFGIVFLSLCAVITVWSVWSSYRFAERQREKIYVLDNGKSLMLALSQDLSQNRPAEAREHVRRFHELFFTLSPAGLSRRQSVCRTAASEAEILHAFLLAHAENAAEVPDGVGGVVVGNVRAQRVHLFVPAFLAAAPAHTLPRDLRREQRAEFVDLLRTPLR